MSPFSRSLGLIVGRLRGTLAQDIAQTTGAFAAIVGIQQVLLLPFIASRATPETFAQVVLIVTISAITANLVGGESANTLLIRGKKYADVGMRWDFHRVFTGAIVIGLFATTAIWTWIDAGPQTVLLAAALTTLTSLRLFLASPFRLEQRFEVVTVAHAAYALMSALSLFLPVGTGMLILPFLVGEVTAVMVLGGALWRDRAQVTLLRHGSPQPFSSSLRTYLALVAAAAFANIVGYLDRLLIVPILGSAALAVYFAASVIPKSVSTLVNPAAGLLLAKFGSLPDAEGPRVLRRLGRMLPFVTGIAVFMALAAGSLGLSVLYPQYSEQGRSVLLPISLAVGMGSSAYLLQPFVLRFLPAAFVIGANATQAVVFAGAALALSASYGITGFAWASALASMVHLSIFVAISYRLALVRPS
jgi:O-antigen/teichoic acid export membrane protein